MTQELEKMAGALLNGEKAAALKENSQSIQKLAQSPDGKKVRALLGDEKQVAKALEQGNGEELKKLMTKVLSTEEGRRLAEQLKGLIG